VSAPAPAPIRDLGIRLWLSPVFGASIPTFSGLVDPARHRLPGLLLTYVYFSLCAFTIWTTNRWLYLRLPRREDWLEKPMRRMSVLLGSIFLLTIPVSWILLSVWVRATGDPGVRPYALPTSILAIVTVVVIITHVYETVFLLADWDSARLRAALLEQERLRAELTALSREVDPHFLFNSLHSLAHLVEHGSSDAVPFIEALGDSYRYVLAARERPLVSLSEEIAALRRQHLLTRIRFGGAVQIELRDLPAEVTERLRIPPVTLSELLTNALKHNTVTSDDPLTLVLRLEDHTLVVENAVRPKPSSPSFVPRPSSLVPVHVGLSNLAHRHRLATGHRVTWEEKDGRFAVRIPLVE
jgi:two-component system, LytTR family, sensor kinase